jgi:hypothetical protein
MLTRARCRPPSYAANASATQFGIGRHDALIALREVFMAGRARASARFAAEAAETPEPVEGIILGRSKPFCLVAKHKNRKESLGFFGEFRRSLFRTHFALQLGSEHGSRPEDKGGAPGRTPRPPSRSPAPGSHASHGCVDAIVETRQP